MKVPPGHTESQVVAIVEKILNKLAKSFAFGIFDAADIRQESWIRVLKLLEDEKYDGKRPLENFLYRIIKNHLINLRRNEFYRPNSPCESCKQDIACPDAPDGGHCKRHRTWLKKNKVKASLQSPQPLPDMVRPDDVPELIAQRELIDLIDSNLPAILRPTWLRLKAGVTVSRHQKRLLEQAIDEIREAKKKGQI